MLSPTIGTQTSFLLRISDGSGVPETWIFRVLELPELETSANNILK